MSNLVRVLYTNHTIADATTVSASSEVISLPAGNVQNPLRTKVWRSKGVTEENLDFNFSVPKAVDQAIAINCNFTAGVTVSLLAATNSSFNPVAVTVPAITYSVLFNMFEWQFASPQEYQFWRIKIQDLNNTNPGLEIGHVLLGPKIDFDYRPGFRLTRIDPSDKVFSYDGQPSVFEKSRFRVAEFLIGDEQNLTKIEDIYIDAGTRRTDLYVMLDPHNDAFDNVADGQHRFTLFGFFRENVYEHRTRGAVSAPIAFEEAR